MSEQKRRNAICDGYAQLIALIGSAGAQTIDLPSRGRPKGGGTNSEGKSGVLFRAIEYCRWPEEGGDTLKEEVLRLEAAAARIIVLQRAKPGCRGKGYPLTWSVHYYSYSRSYKNK